VFLQQLGRGLRRTSGKPVLTVLDFIGQQRREFRFDLKYRALTGTTRTGLQRQLEQGFAFLPSGCELVLDSVARDVVLENVRRQLKFNRKQLVQEIKTHGDVPLEVWLRESGRELADVLKGTSWTALRRAAGLSTPPAGPAEEYLLKRTASVVHVDDPERAERYTERLSGAFSYDELPPREQRFARMLYFSLWPNGGHDSYQDGFDLLMKHPAVLDELRQMISLGLMRAEHVSQSLGDELQEVTMRISAHYSREEILAALDWANLQRRPGPFVAGVVWSETAQTDAFLVTLRKNESEYSPTTMYKDYAISPDLFHWESQNTTAAGSPIGQRYLNHVARGSHILILTRQTKETEWGGPRPYLCLGLGTYVSHESERPIAITWRLQQPMPVDVYRTASVSA
jgi:hypothetical protein